jgi:hypothetical protein
MQLSSLSVHTPLRVKIIESTNLGDAGIGKRIAVILSGSRHQAHKILFDENRETFRRTIRMVCFDTDAFRRRPVVGLGGRDGNREETILKSGRSRIIGRPYQLIAESLSGGLIDFDRLLYKPCLCKLADLRL